MNMLSIMVVEETFYLSEFSTRCPLNCITFPVKVVGAAAEAQFPPVESVFPNNREIRAGTIRPRGP